MANQITALIFSEHRKVLQRQPEFLGVTQQLTLKEVFGRLEEFYRHKHVPQFGADSIKLWKILMMESHVILPHWAFGKVHRVNQMWNGRNVIGFVLLLPLTSRSHLDLGSSSIGPWTT